MFSRSTLNLIPQSRVWDKAPHRENTHFSRRRTVPYAGVAWRGERANSGAGTNKHDHERCCHKVRQETSSQTGLQLSHRTNVFVPQHNVFICVHMEGASNHTSGLAAALAIPCLQSQGNNQAGRSLECQSNSSQHLPKHRLASCDTMDFLINPIFGCGKTPSNDTNSPTLH